MKTRRRPIFGTSRRRGFSFGGLVLLGLALAWLTFDHQLGSRRIKRALAAKQRQRIRNMHRAYPIQAGETVFIGDSITFDADWAAAFEKLRIRNRGIGWDTTEDLLERLDDSLDGPPQTVVMMIGTNDLTLGIPHAGTIRNASLILNRIIEAAPDAKVVIQSVLPRTDRYNPLVTPLNSALARICGERGLAFVDHTESLSGTDGHLDPNCYIDGIHPNDEGYRRLVDGLRPHLEVPHGP